MRTFDVSWVILNEGCMSWMWMLHVSSSFCIIDHSLHLEENFVVSLVFILLNWQSFLIALLDHESLYSWKYFVFKKKKVFCLLEDCCVRESSELLVFIVFVILEESCEFFFFVTGVLWVLVRLSFENPKFKKKKF